ncbi:MAG: hypothetical protein NTX63_02585 [Candidatus Peregrinibacteria bacterium]|nr:hypothetical protein [Candidatus Peregrinibacteria bacterium]
MKNKSPKKDYIDEYKDWQDNQYNPGHFTGGRTPIWLSQPGKPKLLGTVFVILGLCYGIWTTYTIMQLFQVGVTMEETFSATFSSILSISLFAAGIMMIKKANK